MKKVITISRQFGSGGRTIGRSAAEKLGYEFYDKELIEKIAEESGLSREYIEAHGESSPSRNIFAYAFVGRDASGNSVGDYLWRTQRDIIEKIAEKGNCVIVGRCADYILRNRVDCLHVFIHADMDKKKERIVSLYGETDATPEKRLLEKDKTRAMNYKYYTDRTWGMAENYHVSLDSSALGEERCIDLIVGLARIL
ncbi:MAG: cytidylate kinase-like family protein [Lachnospiraceae bacterium]|nr:cytidylate kinase-like family protein [Lachnospiraceae bacterium]